MNASAVLTRQGWRGEGHALDIRGRGVRKPLLIRQKNDGLGVGKKKIDIQADQWWARAFDSALAGLDAGTETGAGAKADGEGNWVVKEEPAKGVSDLHLLATGKGKWSGLYAGFVRGEGLEGTIGEAGMLETRSVLGPEREAERDGGGIESVKKKRKVKKRDLLEPATTSLHDSDDVGSTTHVKHKEKKKHKKRKDTGQIEDQIGSPELLADETGFANSELSREKQNKKEPSQAILEASSTLNDRLAKKKKRKRKHRDRELAAS